MSPPNLRDADAGKLGTVTAAFLRYEHQIGFLPKFTSSFFHVPEGLFMSTPTPPIPVAADPLEIMLAHNQWGNRVLLEACRPLTRAQFHQTFPIGPAERGGLHLTITHIISAAGRWADRIRAINPPRAALEPFPFVPPPGHPAPDVRDRTIDELLELNDRFSADLRDAAAFSRREGLGSTIVLKFPQPPEKGGGFKDYSFTRAAALMHALTHGHWHRAQCVNILRQLGAKGDGLPESSVTEWQAAGEMYLQE